MNYGTAGGLTAGEMVEIVGQTSDGEWYCVRPRSGDLAWVSTAYIAAEAGSVAIPTVDPGAIPATPVPTNARVVPLAPAPTNTALPQLVNTPRPVCDCSGDHYNCTDFASTGAARACYRYCTGLGKGDVHRLDSDDDGLACESLP